MAINTLITIREAIIAFVEGHGQLKRVIFEAEDQRANYITEGDEFPMLFVAPINVAVGRAMNIHTLKFYVYERINDDRTDLMDNANDTSLILRDIRVWWNDYGIDEIEIIEDPIGSFESDRELDKLIGYSAEIRFSIPSHGRCQVPVDVTPFPPSGPCQDGTVTNSNDTYSLAVPSGQTVALPDTSYDVYLNNVFSGVVSVPTLSNEEINITLI